MKLTTQTQKTTEQLQAEIIELGNALILIGQAIDPDINEVSTMVAIGDTKPFVSFWGSVEKPSGTRGIVESLGNIIPPAAARAARLEKLNTEKASIEAEISKLKSHETN